MSVGTAALVVADQLNIAGLVAAADAALYEGKRNGRDLVDPRWGKAGTELAVDKEWLSPPRSTDTSTPS